MAERFNAAQGLSYSLDTRETYLNNNVLVIGTSGSGKTRSIAGPNIMEATGSYVISDPKGHLYKKYAGFLISKGYCVKVLNLVDMSRSDRYNPFAYIHSEQDVIKMAHILVNMDSDAENKNRGDLFWDQTAEILLSSVISYLVETARIEERTFHNVFRLLEDIDVNRIVNNGKCSYDILLERLERSEKSSFAVKQWRKIRVACDETLSSILVSAQAAIGKLDFDECNRVTSKDRMQLFDIGRKKTAVFVIVSDTDRSLDGLANLFFTQAMNELCRVADRTEEGRLEIPVRFILDDFATNVRIEAFPRMIASIRSRDISAIIMIQALSQLKAAYGEDGTTIVGNCDTVIYLGTNDVETAQSIADRVDQPLKKILYMPLNTNWIFRRGYEPINGKNIDPEKYAAERRERRW